MNKNLFRVELLKSIFIMFVSKCFYSLYHRDKNIWVLGEWFGDRCCDNCLFFANYMADNHPDIKLFWIASKTTDLSSLDERVIRLEMDTKDASSVLKKAGVVIINQEIKDITKKSILYYSGALIINLWHGVPWKKIGFDILGSPSVRSSVYLKLRFWIYGKMYYLALSNEFRTIIERAFLCNDNRIIKTGYPRNSLFYNRESLDMAKTKLIRYIYNQYHIHLDNTVRFITYMPTFRDNTNENISFLFSEEEGLISFLTKNNAVILEKKHFVSAYRSDNKPSVKNKGNIFMIGSDFMSQELLAATDVLITDYSSCFFDYLILDRPIIHFLYDYSYYEKEDRGLYYKKEDVVCGDIAENLTQLLPILSDNLSNPTKHKDLREKRKKFFIEYENPYSCADIYNRINVFLHE